MKYNTDKVVSLQGKEYILFEGLLECAHQEYDLQGIDTQLIQIPNEENGHEAIVRAEVITKDGKKFTAIGDANPSNVNSKIRPHLIRMAETRAVGRALRFLTGYGTVFEELGELDEAVQSPKESQPIESPNSKPDPKKATQAQINKIKKDAEKHGLTMDDVLNHFKADVNDLTREQASDIIKWLATEEPQKLKEDQEQLPF